MYEHQQYLKHVNLTFYGTPKTKERANPPLVTGMTNISLS